VIKLHRFVTQPYFFIRGRIQKQRQMGRGEDRPSEEKRAAYRDTSTPRES